MSEPDDIVSYQMEIQTIWKALAIRNKITHGRMARKNVVATKSYYLKLLIILLLYTIRIAEELDVLDIPNESLAGED